MNSRILRIAGSHAALLLLFVAAITGCRSYHVEVSVENRTGIAIQLLEVDYPSASFGADSLAAGAAMHYRIQVRGTGPVKVQYTAGGVQKQITGPSLSERDEGQFLIVLLPESKAEFIPQLSHAK